MKTIKCLIISLLFTPLIATATAYVEEGDFGGIPHGGYNDVTINANTAIISFRGSSSDSPVRIKKLLLYRCAEVAMNYGYDYFVVTSTSLSPTNINIKAKKTYKQMYPPTSTPNKAYSVSKIQSYSESDTAATSCEQNTSSVCRTHAAFAVIKMYNGEIPSGMPRAYAVTDILAQFGPST